MRKLIALGFVFCLGIAQAGTVYVATTGSDKTGDGTEGNPYKTIQKGVGNAVAGDTVIVGAGDYSDLGGVFTADPDKSFVFQMTNVVYITKRITLQGAGRGKTFITGRYGDGTAQDGTANTWAETGNGAVRCVLVTAGGTGTIIKGFTIRKGSTVRAKTGVNNDVDIGGGVVAVSSTVYMYDCDITDCRAGDGAAVSRDVRCCRCYFARNKTKATSGQVQYRNSYTFNCLFEDNGGGSGSIFTTVQDFKVVNCTFINNKVGQIFNVNYSDKKSEAENPHAYIYNCLVVDSKTLDGGARIASYFLTNVVQTYTAAQGAAITNYVSSGCQWGVNKVLQYISPATNDWRSVEGNAIVGNGDVSALTTAITGMQSADLTTDYNGNPRKVNNKVSVGCFEPTSTVSADDYLGSFKFVGGAKVMKGNKTISGEPIVAGRWWGLEGGVGQVRVGYTGTEELFGYEVAYDGTYLGSESYTTSRFPDNNGDQGFWLTPTKGGLMTITAIPATGIKWVDASSTAENPDGSEAKPYKLISEAVSNVAVRGIVKVNPGVYSNGVMSLTESKVVKNYRIHMYKDVAIRSTEGAEKTVLRGGSDINAIVRHTGSTIFGHIQGFTLTGCANDPSVDENQGETGSALQCNINDAVAGARNTSEVMHLTDSIISNNVSAGRTCIGGWLERCLLIDNFTTVANMNKGTTGGARGTQAYASILSGCVSYYSPIYFTAGHYPTVNTCAHQNCTDINCTFYIPNWDAIGLSYRSYNTPNGYTVAINNAAVSPILDSYAPSIVIYAAGNVSSPTGPTGSKYSYQKVVPEGGFFADYANHDFYPISGSVGFDYSVVTTNKYVRYETGDFNGKPLAYEANGGKAIPGAFQEVRVMTVAKDEGRGTTSPCGKVNALGGAEVTVAAGDGSRPLLGWDVDGTFEAASAMAYTYTVDITKAQKTVTPVFSTNLYVKASAANDNANGFTAETPKKYLRSVGEMAVSGDVIHAAAGDYNAGVVTQKTSIAKITTDGFSPSRIVLNSGVTLEGEGAGTTYITGVATKGNYGVRCVAANAGAVVRGFTIRNGATYNTTGTERDNNMGGCLLAPLATNKVETAFIEDCVLSNGNARTGGTVAGGYLHRCRIYGGTSGAGASISQYSQLDQCFATGDSNTGVREHFGIRSSTIINLSKGNVYGDMLRSIGSAMTENSIIVGRNNDDDLKEQSKTYRGMKNCIWNVGGNKVTLDSASCQNVITCEVNTTSLSTALASLNLDSNGRPLAGAPSIDEGDNSYLTKLHDKSGDMGKDQRIYNATVDIGAYEYVCTNEFSAAVCGRRAAVTYATPMTELKDAALEIPASDELGIRWAANKAGEGARMAVTLAQDTSLKVYAGDELIKTITESGTCELTSPSANIDLRLVAEGGTATLASFVPKAPGMVLIFK